ncbi:MAG: AraC family transcriptional regulator [Roseivirga sp.]|nr:AraC family transcriptional regulator [Roseivirga sp.]
MILTNKGVLRNNRPAWVALIVIVAFAIHNQIDAWLYYNGFGASIWVGTSFLHYHLMGGLFLFFTHKLVGISVNLRFWLLVLGGYTLIRVLFLLPDDAAAYENYSENISWTDVGLAIDNLVSNGLNVATLLIAHLRVKRLHFSVQLDKKEQLNYLWLKNLLLLLVFIYIAVVINTFISLIYPDDWLTFWKLESMMLGLFFFVLAYFAIRFPVFSVYGDFKDLQKKEKKYANSSLTEPASRAIWEELRGVMLEEKPYRNSEYRLNDLALRLDQSVHHVSQVINECEGASFSDLINRYRIKEAQNLLTSDRAKQITILAIALEAGFNSKTAFYNTFKKETGQTPSQFMRTRK